MTQQTHITKGVQARQSGIDWKGIEKNLTRASSEYFEKISDAAEQARVIEIGVQMHAVAKRTSLPNAATGAMENVIAKVWEKAWPQVAGEMKQLRDDIGVQRSTIQSSIVKFQAESARLTGVKEAIKNTPQGGEDFQACLSNKLREILPSECLVTDVGSVTGALKGRKTGDVTAAFDDESIYAGHSIVFEAKNQEGVSLKKATEEIELAKRNRRATKGVFVYAFDKAPPEMNRLFHQRDGNIFVKWSPETPALDSLLIAAYIVAKSDIVKPMAARKEIHFDVEELERELASGISTLEFHNDVLNNMQTITNAVGKASMAINKSMKQLQHVFESFERNLISVIRAKNTD